MTFVFLRNSPGGGKNRQDEFGLFRHPQARGQALLVSQILKQCCNHKNKVAVAILATKKRCANFGGHPRLFSNTVFEFVVSTVTEKKEILNPLSGGSGLGGSARKWIQTS